MANISSHENARRSHISEASTSNYMQETPYAADLNDSVDPSFNGLDMVRGVDPPFNIKSKILSKHTNYTSASPSLMKKYGNYEVSTASSSRSALSRNANTILSFESSLSHSNGTGFKFSRQNFLPNVPNDSRIQSAQFSSDHIFQSPLKINENDKRIYSAMDPEKPQGPLINNRHNNNGNNKEVFLDYSISKNLEEFGPNPFDKNQKIDGFDPNNMDSMIPKSKNGEHFPSIEKIPYNNSKYEISQKTQNPYKTEKLHISLKKRDLLSGNEEVEQENDNSKFQIKNINNKKFPNYDRKDNNLLERYN